jgi:hypothetical protein
MPHKTFAEYDPEDTTALPCPCWMAGREGAPGRGDADDYEHPDEFRDGAEARYEYENDI